MGRFRPLLSSASLSRFGAGRESWLGRKTVWPNKTTFPSDNVLLGFFEVASGRRDQQKKGVGAAPLRLGEEPLLIVFRSVDR